MLEITVSNDNFTSLLSLPDNEEVTIGHVGSREVVKLIKITNAIKPKRLTIEQIETMLGFPVEIISNGTV